MKSDPIYLFQASAQKASLGVLSVAGNVCMCIISDVSKNVNVLLLKLALVLECLGDFDGVCEDIDDEFGSMDEILNGKNMSI